MPKAHKKLHHHVTKHKNAVTILGLFIVSAIILSGIFFITRGADPHTAELAFTEYSSLGRSSGSVIPASCESGVDHWQTQTCGDGSVISICSFCPAPTCQAWSGTRSAGCPSGYTGGQVWRDHYSCPNGYQPAQYSYSTLESDTCTAPQSQPPTPPAGPTPGCSCGPATCEGPNLVSRNTCTGSWEAVGNESGCSVDWNSPSCVAPPSSPPADPNACGAGNWWDGDSCCSIGYYCYDIPPYTPPSPSYEPACGTTSPYCTGGWYASGTAYTAPNGTQFWNCSGTDYTIQCSYTPPVPSQLFLNITPRSIERGGIISLSWSIKDPNSTCKITADVQKPATCNGTCSASVAAASSTLNMSLTSGMTNANDPNGSRVMTTALQTPVSGTYAKGVKSVTLDYTTAFNLSCGTSTAPVKSIIYVTTNNEG